MKLLAAFGLPVCRAEIPIFGKTRALVIERFDRRWTMEGRLSRLPQEDLCQALSCPPTRKYQSEAGPGMVDILKLLKARDTLEDVAGRAENSMEALAKQLPKRLSQETHVAVFKGMNSRLRTI